MFGMGLRCVWHGFAQDAKRSYDTKPWLFIEFRSLRSGIRLRCVWHADLTGVGGSEVWGWEDEDWKSGTYHLTRSTL